MIPLYLFPTYFTQNILSTDSKLPGSGLWVFSRIIFANTATMAFIYLNLIFLKSSLKGRETLSAVLVVWLDQISISLSLG